MHEVLGALAFGGGVCLLFGVVYPVMAILAYPVYRMFGGDMSLLEYIKIL